jgi:hypothetical protein
MICSAPSSPACSTARSRSGIKLSPPFREKVFFP